MSVNSSSDLAMFKVDNSTGTLPDLALVYGWGYILKLITGGDVALNNSGGVIQLKPEKSLDAAALKRAMHLGGLIKFLDTKNSTHPGYVDHFVNYDKERSKAVNLREWKKNLPKGKIQAAPDDMDEQPQGPDPNLPLYELVNQMQGISAYNKVVERWYADQAYWPEYIALLADYFATTPNDLIRLERAWQELAKDKGIAGGAKVTATQVLNPTGGKGGDAAKANSLAIGQKDSFWLLELVKIVGMQIAGLPLLVSKSKDRKTYMPVPNRLSLEIHTYIWNSFKETMYGNSAIKMDVMVSLRYTLAFIEQWRDGNNLELKDITEPSDCITGLLVAHYKDLGSAKVLINLAQINLPEWVTLVKGQPESAQLYVDLLEEHRKVVAFLDEKKGEEYHLLQLYRDFLSGRTLEPFYAFAAGYAQIIMKRLAGGQSVFYFTTTNMEILIMAYDKQDKESKRLRPSEVIHNEGFRSIATAIRLSTIVPQGQKARKQQPLYEIRYGLGDELRRKAAYCDDLTQAVAEFVHSYNQETSQKFERTGGQQRRKLVTTNELDRFMVLLDNEKDSALVGSLLVAYGYARDPRDPDSKTEQPIQEVVNEPEDLSELSSDEDE